MSNTKDIPAGEGITDDDYKSRPGQSDSVPVVPDNKVEDVDTTNADSDAQLGISYWTDI